MAEGSLLDEYNKNRYDSKAIFTMVAIVVVVIVAIYYLRKFHKMFFITQL